MNRLNEGDLEPLYEHLRAMGTQSGNNLGYFGPEEALLRSPKPGMADHFQSCQAGRQLLGIEANGAV